VQKTHTERNHQAGDYSEVDMKSNYSKNSGEDLHRIASLLEDINDMEPPDTLVGSVMAGIRPKKLTWCKKLWRQLQTPIYVTPMRIAQLSAVAVALMLVTMVFLNRNQNRNDVTLILNRTTQTGKVVVFTLDMPDASNVELIGSFNQWTPEGYRMYRDEQRGVWKLSVPLGSGRYEYAFLIDGEMVVPDPKGLLQQDDGFGNKNSILIINRESDHETAT
jgi:hypothetical protein